MPDEAYQTPSGRPFLFDYLHFNEGNECPESYHIWSALALLSAVISRKVHMDFDGYRVYPNLYICLVGRQGLRKSTAKDIARDILEDEFPNIPRAASVTSKEAITKHMASDEVLRVYKEPSGVLIEYRPLTLFVNELKNFLSVNPQGMIDFLTDIYDRKFFDTLYKTAGQDTIINPYVVMLACETDKWMRDKMKMDIISGGFARRLIPIYEVDKRCSIPRPFMTPSMVEARKHVIKRLHEIKDITGRFSWEADAIKFYDEWYSSLKEPSDPMMEGFYSSIHTQLQKIAMLITIADFGDLLIRRATLERGLLLLDHIKPNMHHLYSSAGLNVHASVARILMTYIESQNGAILETEFLRIAFKDLTDRDAVSVVSHWEKTGQIKRVRMEVKGVARVFLMTPDAYRRVKAGTESNPPDASSSATPTSPHP